MAKATTALSLKIIESFDSVKEMTDSDLISAHWIGTYERCHGAKDGKERYEREKIFFTQAISGADSLAKTSRYSQYVCLMRMAVAAVSLDDGQAALIPRAGKCTLHIQWKGRKAQMMRIPTVIHIDEPQIVYDCDCDAKYTDLPYRPTRSMNGIFINDWRPAINRPENAKIQYVYVIVTFRHGMKAYDMDREDLLTIRDEYSEPYKEWIQLMAEKKAAVDAGTPWPAGKVKKGKRDGSFYWADEKPPMWVTREAEACKKTMIHRLWKSMTEDVPGYIRYVDEEIAKENRALGVRNEEHADEEYNFSPDFINQNAPVVPAAIATAPAATPVAKKEPVKPATPEERPLQPVWNSATGEWEIPEREPVPETKAAPATATLPDLPDFTAPAEQAPMQFQPTQEEPAGDDLGDLNSSF